MSNITKPGGGGLEDGENFDGQGTSDFSNLQSVGTDKVNNVIWAEPGDDYAALLSDAQDSDNRRSGVVKLVPSTASDRNSHSIGNLEVPNGVTLDMRSTFIDGQTAAASEFVIEPAPNATVLAHGAHIDSFNMASGSAHFQTDADANQYGPTDAPMVLGFPELAGPDTWCLRAVESAGGDTAGGRWELYSNGTGLVKMESTGSGFINDHDVLLYGASTPGNAPTGYPIDLGGGGTVAHNQIETRQIQLKGDGTGTVVRFAGGAESNQIEGVIADWAVNAANLVEWAAGTDGHNLIKLTGRYIQQDLSGFVVDNDGKASNTIMMDDGTELPRDLSTMAGDKHGMERMNDGAANTAPTGPAVWDSSLASGAGNWQSTVDGSTFGPN